MSMYHTKVEKFAISSICKRSLPRRVSSDDIQNLCARRRMLALSSCILLSPEKRSALIHYANICALLWTTQTLPRLPRERKWMGWMSATQKPCISLVAFKPCRAIRQAAIDTPTHTIRSGNKAGKELTSDAYHLRL